MKIDTTTSPAAADTTAAAADTTVEETTAAAGDTTAEEATTGAAETSPAAPAELPCMNHTTCPKYECKKDDGRSIPPLYNINNTHLAGKYFINAI